MLLLLLFKIETPRYISSLMEEEGLESQGRGRSSH
jgi:hypothetical protein